jgi:hypothetical protein
MQAALKARNFNVISLAFFIGLIACDVNKRIERAIFECRKEGLRCTRRKSKKASALQDDQIGIIEALGAL